MENVPLHILRLTPTSLPSPWKDVFSFLVGPVAVLDSLLNNPGLSRLTEDDLRSVSPIVTRSRHLLEQTLDKLAVVAPRTWNIGWAIRKVVWHVDAAFSGLAVIDTPGEHIPPLSPSQRERHVANIRDKLVEHRNAFPQRELLERLHEAVTADKVIDLASDLFGTQDDEASKGTNSIRIIGEVWHLRWGKEYGEYPKTGNQCLNWLAVLLATPNRLFTVADLRGDPEGKLMSDGLISGECETDLEGMHRIKTRLEEIEEITAETGGSETIEGERTALLCQIQMANTQITSALRRAHHTMASQLRNLLRGKLAKGMSKLAAHLKVSLRLDYPHFGYYPSADTPAWKS